MKIELFKLDEQFSQHCLTKTSQRSIQRARSREYNDLKNGKFNYQSGKKHVQMSSLETFSDDVSDGLRKNMLQPPSGCTTPRDTSPRDIATTAHGVTISRDMSASRNSIGTYEENIATQRSITLVSSRAPLSPISDRADSNDNINPVKWMENELANYQQLMKTVDVDEIKTFLDEFRQKNVSIKDLIGIKHDTVAFQKFQNGFTSNSFVLWLAVATSINNL